MTVKHRLKKLENLSPTEPYQLENPYLRDVCAELGVPPVIYPANPDDVLREAQAQLQAAQC